MDDFLSEAYGHVATADDAAQAPRNDWEQKIEKLKGALESVAAAANMVRYRDPRRSSLNENGARVERYSVEGVSTISLGYQDEKDNSFTHAALEFDARKGAIRGIKCGQEPGEWRPLSDFYQLGKGMIKSFVVALQGRFNHAEFHDFRQGLEALGQAREHQAIAPRSSSNIVS